MFTWKNKQTKNPLDLQKYIFFWTFPTYYFDENINIEKSVDS